MNERELNSDCEHYERCETGRKEIMNGWKRILEERNEEWARPGGNGGLAAWQLTLLDVTFTVCWQFVWKPSHLWLEVWLMSLSALLCHVRWGHGLLPGFSDSPTNTHTHTQTHEHTHMQRTNQELYACLMLNKTSLCLLIYSTSHQNKGKMMERHKEAFPQSVSQSVSLSVRHRAWWRGLVCET